MPGLLGDLGAGLQSAGAALNPQVMQGLQRERLQTQENQQLQARQIVQNVIQGVQDGSIPPEQGQAVLQRMGIQMPVGPSMRTQQAQQQQQLNQQAMQWMQQRQQQGQSGPGLGGASLQDIPPQLLGTPMVQNALKLQDTLATHENLRQTREQQGIDRERMLQQREEESRQRSEDRKASLDDRQQARTESIALRRELARSRGQKDTGAAPPQPQDDASKTATDLAAWNYINNRTLPYRKGTGGGRDRNDAIMNRAGAIANELGMSAEELASKPATFRADAQSLAFSTKKLDSIQGVLSSFHNNVETWDSIAQGNAPALGGEKAKQMGDMLSKINFVGVRSVDDLKLRVQEQVNDPTAAAYLTATLAVSMDYARIMQGPQSTASLTEGARKDAMRLISAGANDKARKAIIGTLYSDTEGQIKGLSDQVDKIKTRMGRGTKPAAPTAPSTSPKVVNWSDLK